MRLCDVGNDLVGSSDYECFILFKVPVIHINFRGAMVLFQMFQAPLCDACVGGKFCEYFTTLVFWQF